MWVDTNVASVYQALVHSAETVNRSDCRGTGVDNYLIAKIGILFHSDVICSGNYQQWNIRDAITENVQVLLFSDAPRHHHIHAQIL